MPDRTEQINVRVTESTKQKWKQFDEESRKVDGISDLIRKAANAYIEANGNAGAMGDGSNQSGSNVPDDLSRRLASIEDQLGSVSTTVNRIDDTTGFIEEKIVENDGEGMSLSDRLMRVIPPAKPHSKEWRDTKEEFESRPEGEPIVWEGTVEAIADALDAENDLVAQALQSANLNDNIPVNASSIEDKQRYWGPRDLNFALFADARMSEDERENAPIPPREGER